MARRYKSRYSRYKQRPVRYSSRQRKATTNPFKKYGLIAGSKEFLHSLFFTKEGLKKVGIGALVFLGLIIALFGWYAKDLPSPGKINSRLSEQSTQIFDRNGKILYEIHGNKNRIVVDLKDMPKYMQEATIAVEDKGFYKHHGFDVKRIIGSGLYNLVHREKAQGGSTITQQFVKNAILTNEKSYSRKIKEFMLAVMIEQMYSKDDILKMYLNEIPYGSSAYGVQIAAKTYFNKDAKRLTLEQCALLAALPQAPTYYSPYGQHKQELLDRKNLVLDLMADQGYITKEDADKAKKKKITFSGKAYGDISAPHFVMYVKEQLTEKYGENMVDSGGLKVYTTLDYSKQKMAEEAVAKNVDQNRGVYNATNASLVAMNPKNGQILAMVGSRNFFDKKIDGNVNVSVMSRQPGSSFKPFIYATLMKKNNWGPGSTFYDLRTNFGGGYSPNNYDGAFDGPMSMRKALQGSRNIPAVKALYMAGVKDSLDTAHTMGISTLKNQNQYGLSLVLGSGEVKLVDMVGAYGVFADNGVKKEPTWFTKIEDDKGKVLEQYKEKSGKQVLDPQIAYLMSNMLSDDGARAYVFGAGGPLTLYGRPVAAKTGTTDNYKDAWTLGYTPSLVAGVWAGNNDGTPMTSAGGAIAAAPIWHDFMSKALEGTSIEYFNRPSGIKTVVLDGITGKKPTSSSKRNITDLFPSWYQLPYGAEGGEYKIDKLSGKLATPYCPPELVVKKIKSIITAEIPSSDPSYWSWQSSVSSWASANGYSSSGSIPTEKCNLHTAGGAPSISITSPADGDNVGGTITINLNVDAPKGAKTVTVTIDGSKSYKASPMSNGNGYTATVSLTPGTHTLSAYVKDNVSQSAKSSTITLNAVGAP